MASTEEKTEKATPKRLREARKKGQISSSPEVAAWTGLLVATFVVPRVFHSVVQTAGNTLVQAGAIIRDPDTGRAMTLATSSMKTAITQVIPLAIMIGAIGVTGVAAQGGIHVSLSKLKPKFSKLNPLNGFKRIFGPHGIWELAKAVMKTSVLALVVYFSVRKLIPTVYGAGSMPLSALIKIATGTALNVLRAAAVTGLVMAGADYAVVRRRNNKTLKMTKQEVKEEHKSQEGDPHVKGQRRARAIAMARSRMMRDVPSADVVLVNPTHVAVALKYEPGTGAPRVVAKGADHVAARIRKIAEENRVPMVRDVPLARTLFASLEVGEEIPPELYKAVATVLAFIMTLKRRGSAAGLHSLPGATPIPA
jgi:flagellar biosynthetic protein FlhB